MAVERALSRAARVRAYLEHVAQRYDLLRDITFNTRVTGATFDEDTDTWTVDDRHGRGVKRPPPHRRRRRAVRARTRPTFPGIDSFGGESYHTGLWPHETVDFTGKRVGVVGTGASAVQAIPLIAQEAAELTVFQRTANYILPANNGPVPEDVHQARLADYAGIRERLQSRRSARADTLGERCAGVDRRGDARELKERWDDGGFGIWLGSYADIFFIDEANAKVREFLHDRIREKVHDPETAEMLTPTGYPFGVKRNPLDSGLLRDVQPAARAPRRREVEPDRRDHPDRRAAAGRDRVRARRHRLRHRLRRNDRPSHPHRHSGPRRPAAARQVGARAAHLPRPDQSRASRTCSPSPAPRARRCCPTCRCPSSSTSISIADHRRAAGPGRDHHRAHQEAEDAWVEYNAELVRADVVRDRRHVVHGRQHPWQTSRLHAQLRPRRPLPGEVRRDRGRTITRASCSTPNK